jgi:hypothetical protein
VTAHNLWYYRRPRAQFKSQSKKPPPTPAAQCPTRAQFPVGPSEIRVFITSGSASAIEHNCWLTSMTESAALFREEFRGIGAIRPGTALFPARFTFRRCPTRTRRACQACHPNHDAPGRAKQSSTLHRSGILESAGKPRQRKVRSDGCGGLQPSERTLDSLLL